MKVKVISLTREAKFLSNLNFEYFDGVRPNSYKGKLHFDNNLFMMRYGVEPKEGEIGCTLSHAEIIHSFSNEKTNTNFLAIFEDDAIPEETLPSFLDSFDNEKDTSPKIYVVGFSAIRKERRVLHKIKWPLRNKKLIDRHWFGNTHINLCGTVAYIISKEAAKIFANQTTIF